MKDLPNLDNLDKKNSGRVIEVLYSNGNKIKTFGDIDNDSVEFYELPQHLIDAVISIEDRKFFDHGGIDFTSIIRALYINHQRGYVAQGASTITQQLAKLLFLSSHKTIKRKVQEALLALQIERRFSKEKILTMYLNRAYFGSGNYGVKKAARSYFNKDVSNINLNEAAILAAILKAPSRLSPKKNPKLAEERANFVLKNMIKYDYLNENHISQIADVPNYKVDSLQRLYFADIAKRNFKYYLPTNWQRDDLVVITTSLDEDMQKIVSRQLQIFLSENHDKVKQSQVAAIVMDYEGRVKSLIGGKDYQDSQFNRAFDARRQAGSLFKTFVYLTAFEQGMAQDDIIKDEKITFSDWLPNNYNGKYYGDVDLKTAFAKSLNSVSIQLANKVSLNKVIDLLQKFGLKAQKDDGLTVALGSTSVSLYELVSSYAIIANGGNFIMPSYIEAISSNNDILYQRYGSDLGPIIDENSWQMIDSLLLEVVNNGTGKNAAVKNNIRGKTGTSQKFRDAWFIGYDDKHIVGVWIGNDDYSPTEKISGSTLPAILFSQIIDNIDHAM